MGRQLTQSDYDYGGANVVYSRSSSFDLAGKLTYDSNTTVKSDGTYTTSSGYGYTTGSGEYLLGAVGSVSSSNYKNGAYQNSSTTTNAFQWWNGAVQSTITYSQGGNTFTTDLVYDGLGTLRFAHIKDGRPRRAYYGATADGQIFQRDEEDYNNSTGDPHELWYRFGGREWGYIGNNGTSKLTEAASIADRTAVGGSGNFRNGATYATSASEFSHGYDPINSYNQGSAAGAYTVQRTGESLRGIAQGLWGDASLWYKLAEANGLSAETNLVEGQRLTIPAGVIRNTYNAGTVKPYNPADAIGNIQPTTPKPVPPKKKSCLGQIFLAIIAIAVTVLLKAPLTNLIAGKTAVAAAGAAGIAGGSAAGIAGFAGAAMAGSIVSQGIGVATGIQDKFSWGAVAMAGIGAAVGGALGGIGLFDKIGSPFLADVARGALGSAITQGIGVATGLQDKFSWAGVAAAGIGNGVGLGVGRELGKSSGFFAAGFGNDAISTAASTLANAATRSAIEGSNFGDNIIAALPDAIGGVLGRALGGAAGKALENVRDQSDEIIVTSNGGRRGDVIADGAVSDPALQTLVDSAKAYNLKGLENDYEDARSDAREMREKLTSAKNEGESAKRVASLEQKLEQREERVLRASAALAPAISADRALQNYFVGKDVVVTIDGKEAYYKIRGSSVTFSSADDAAYDAIATARVLSAAMGDNVERTGYILSRPGGGFAYEYPYSLGGNNSTLKTYSIGRELSAPVDQFPIPRNAVGMWHTHPKSGSGDYLANMYFGEADIKAAQQVSSRISKSSFSAYLGGSDGAVRVIRNANSYPSGFDGSKVPKTDYLVIGPGYLRLR